MGKKTWSARAYLEYEIEASTEEESIQRLTQIVMQNLKEHKDIREIAEVNSEKISDEGMVEGDADVEDFEDADEELVEKTDIGEGVQRIVRKSSEHSVTPQIIKKIHEMLSSEQVGGEMLDFLEEAEPVFMDHVAHSAGTLAVGLSDISPEEREQSTEDIISWSQVFGFLVAREAMYKMYGGLASNTHENKKDIVSSGHDEAVKKGIGSSTPGTGDRLMDAFKHALKLLQSAEVKLGEAKTEKKAKKKVKKRKKK